MLPPGCWQPCRNHFGREHVSAVHTLRAIRTIVNEALAVLERDFVALGDLESSPL